MAKSCKHCGAIMRDSATVCRQCGASSSLGIPRRSNKLSAIQCIALCIAVLAIVIVSVLLLTHIQKDNSQVAPNDFGIIKNEMSIILPSQPVVSSDENVPNRNEFTEITDGMPTNYVDITLEEYNLPVADYIQAKKYEGFTVIEKPYSDELSDDTPYIEAARLADTAYWVCGGPWGNRLVLASDESLVMVLQPCTSSVLNVYQLISSFSVDGFAFLVDAEPERIQMRDEYLVWDLNNVFFVVKELGGVDWKDNRAIQYYFVNKAFCNVENMPDFHTDFSVISEDNFEQSVNMHYRNDWYDNGIFQAFFNSTFDGSNSYAYVGTMGSILGYEYLDYTSFDVYKVTLSSGDVAYYLMPYNEYIGNPPVVLAFQRNGIPTEAWMGAQ